MQAASIQAVLFFYISPTLLLKNERSGNYFILKLKFFVRIPGKIFFIEIFNGIKEREEGFDLVRYSSGMV